MQHRIQNASILVWVLISVMSLSLWSPMRSLAQSSLSFSALEVDLWPEYDRPSVLVIYRITLAASTTLPADLTVRIPAVAGEPNAVAVKQMDGNLFSVAYERQVSGEWALISFTATSPEVQIEYYDPGLLKEEAARQYEYRWPGDYAVESLSIQVQQPLGATALRTSPSLGAGTTGRDGLVYYTSQIGSLAAGQTFRVAVDYQKAGDGLSAEQLTVQPSAPVTSNTQGWKTGFMAVLPWGLGVLGVVLIVGGGLWYWQTGKQKKKTEPPRRRRRAVTPAAEPAAAEGHIYCHHCGKRAGPGDRFCRTCGTRLRLEG